MAASAKDKLIVLELTPGPEVSAESAAALTESVAISAAQAGIYDVISARELQTLVGAQRQRQLVGCSDDTGCMTEIGSALGARYLLRGSVGKLGTSFQLALQLVDSKRAETIGRSARFAPTVEGIRARIPYAVATAVGLPPPPGPSVAPAIASLAGGGVLLVGGALLGGLGMVEDDALAREQQSGAGSLATRETYASARDRLFLQKTGALAAVVLGAGLTGLGIFLWPPDLSGSAVTLTVGPSSVGIAGVFP